MKRSIPKDWLNKDTVKTIFEKNSDAAIIQNLDRYTIVTMGSLFDVKGSVESKIISDIRMKLSSSVDELPVLCKISMSDEVDIRLLENPNDTLTLEIFAEGTLRYTANFNKSTLGWKDYAIKDLGSGRSESDGTRYIAISIIEFNKDALSPMYMKFAVSLDIYGDYNEYDRYGWDNYKYRKDCVYSPKLDDFIAFH